MTFVFHVRSFVFHVRSFVTLTLVAILTAGLYAKTDDVEPCVRVNSCSCKNSTHVIDMSPLGLTNGSARFVIHVPHDNHTYYWNPCYDFSYPADPPLGGRCTGVAICIVNQTYYDNVGVQSTSTFVTDPNTHTPMIRYTHRSPHQPADVTPVVAFALLMCSSKAPGFGQASGEDNPGEYGFAYKGVYACPRLINPVTPITDNVTSVTVHPSTSTSGGMSFGTILIIVFFICLSIYLIAGVAYEKFALREHGVRLFPNYDIWVNILSYIKEGILFTVSCGTSIPNYEKYDQM